MDNPTFIKDDDIGVKKTNGSSRSSVSSDSTSNVDENSDAPQVCRSYNFEFKALVGV